MIRLMEELSSTENKISFARQAFNDSVTSYNIACETFPNALVANPFGFKPAAMLEIENAQERESPKVKF
jgi:LemA protein